MFNLHQVITIAVNDVHPACHVSWLQMWWVEQMWNLGSSWDEEKCRRDLQCKKKRDNGEQTSTLNYWKKELVPLQGLCNQSESGGSSLAMSGSFVPGSFAGTGGEAFWRWDCCGSKP